MEGLKEGKAMSERRHLVRRNIILIPDSFKGTLSSKQICEILEEQIRKILPEYNPISLPVADGGEGSVDAFLHAVGGERMQCRARDPLFREIEAFFGRLADGRTGVIEMAAAAGLPLVEREKDPMHATTWGVGELMLAAAASGCTELIVGLGGSATNDGGTGAAAACGAAFYDSTGKAFVPTGGTLSQIERIDMKEMDPRICGMKITAICDIDNPLCGPEGASFVFAPQKGARAEELQILDEGLSHLADVIQRDLGISVKTLAGGGAAGGMGAGMQAFFGAELKPGIQTVLDAANFDSLMPEAALVITGEGRLDSQSLRGKVIGGVAGRARRYGVPVIALAGGIETNAADLDALGVTAAFSINRMPEDFSVSRYKSRENLSFAAENILRLLKSLLGDESK